ncbi:MAG: hypothetical protein IPM13_03215 [Phycisphaerales bacterium]|nr:hypothetical protein [Phycisphaerales bacterium]
MTACPPRLLHVLRDPPLDGPTNMARDEHLLHSEAYRPAALRLYAWTPPTISLGYFQRFADLDRLPPELRELAVVRRTTGGGAILHDREITYCLVLDDSVPVARRAPLALYELVHTCWRNALAEDEGPRSELAPPDYPLPTPRTGPFFCFQKPGRTDLIVGEQKLLGSAQRRTAGRVLQHGSLLLGQRFRAHPGVDLGGVPEARASRWQDAFVRRLAQALDLEVAPAAWQCAELADCERRRAKYASPEWTQRL